MGWKTPAEEEKKINVGVGFVTGRKSFRKVLNTYVYRWKETSAEVKKRVNLYLFVAYDLDYGHTHKEDYVNIQQDILNGIDGVVFISQGTIEQECSLLVEEGVLQPDEAELIFAKGYAGKRNSTLYFALKHQMDYLIFLDDDEYPLAVTRTREIALWSGQNVLVDHLKFLKDADMTNGYHCGYLSPIPYIGFNETLPEADFRLFIEAISNDVLGWENIVQIMQNGGVTYADPQVFIDNRAFDVPEVHHARFISGSNLGINLTHTELIKPFYNPPGARGEDTFLSTGLAKHKLLRIPTYTFHDGFSAYGHLLDGVLPLRLKHINAGNETINTRFYRACLGWIRYKPLYLYLTRPEQFAQETKEIRLRLKSSIPAMSAYFAPRNFSRILTEFNRYTRRVEDHYQSFLACQRIWERCKAYAIERSAPMP